MEYKIHIRPLTQTERQFATEKYYLIIEFLKRSRLDAEDFFDIVVFDFLSAVETYLNSAGLQQKCEFEAVACMYMKRAVYRHFRKEKTQKRSTDAGADISMDSINGCISQSVMMENISMMEYAEIIREIKSNLTLEQQKIFFDKLAGYSLKEIAEKNGIKQKRVYKQFGKVKNVVADVMQIKRL